MKKPVKIIIIAIPLIVIISIAIFILYPKLSMSLRNGKWTKEDGFYVYYKDGVKLVDQEITSGGKYYIVDKEGHRIENYTVTDKKGNILSFYGSDGAQIRDGFAEIKGIEYYFDNSGKLGKNQWAQDKYVDKNGKITKKKWVDGFYLDENGNKAKSTWVKNKYVGSDGKVLKSTTTPDGFEVDKYGNKIVPLLEQLSANEYSFGTEITFGNFEQDGDSTNGPEPIEWMLVTHTKDKAYLLSKKVLYNCKYQEEDEAVLGKVSFNNSFIKHWLTNNFYANSFTDDEKQYISNTENGYVFIPSVKEVEEYLPDNVYRLAPPSKLAKDSTKQSKNIDNASIYWLRDGGSSILYKSFVSDVGDIINDDVTKEVVVENYYKKGESKKESASDKAGKLLLGKGAKYLVGQIPIFGDIINELGFTDDMIDSMTGGDNNEDEYELVEEKGKNEYLNVGLVTNEFNGVRPMLVIDLEHKTNVKDVKDNNKTLKENINDAKLLKGYDFTTCIEDIDTVTFGSMEQDGNDRNGNEPLEWVVLKRDEDKALLLTKYIIKLDSYNEEKEEVTYENSTIRKYLNSEFYDEVFDGSEKQLIVESVIANNDNNNIYQRSSSGKEKRNETLGGNETNDKVFLLNFNEVQSYFGKLACAGMNDSKLTDKEREYFDTNTNICNTTITKSINDEYTHENGKSYKNYPPLKITSEKYKQTDWWLRDPGKKQEYACFVSDGVDDKGASVTSIKGVRPAVWVKMQ